MDQPLEVVNVFDNNGHTLDRFTINVMSEDGDCWVIACSDNPAHPLGVWSVGENEFINVEELTDEDVHIGKEINWESLPAKVKEAVINWIDN